MSTEQMRVALANHYSTSFVSKMKDDQVIAVFKRLKAKNII